MQFKRVEPPKKHIPIMHTSTTCLEKTVKPLQQPLKKTVELLTEVNGKTLVREIEVVDKAAKLDVSLTRTV